MNPPTIPTQNQLSRSGQFLIFNLAIVALIGCIMRYKIGFDFPYLDQKNLQHAHSHFAFAGWISLGLYLLIHHSANRSIAMIPGLMKGQALVAIAMLFSFAAGGYNIFSITFSTLTVIISYIFLFEYTRCTHQQTDEQPWVKWFRWGLVFQALSSLGTFVLAYMMASHQFHQHTYLASVYFFLHFQYNGWFLFGIIGSTLMYLKKVHGLTIDDRLPFSLLKWSVAPAYGLSVLWLDLPWYLLSVIILFVILQTIAITLLFARLFRLKKQVLPSMSTVVRVGSLFAGTAYLIKFLLQLFSVIPALSELAFGFRPIVIAYLHLVLLAATSTTLLVLLCGMRLLQNNATFTRGFIILLIGIFLNETVLAIQGFASFDYIAIPWANLALVFISILMLAGIITMFMAQFKTRQPVI